ARPKTANGDLLVLIEGLRDDVRQVAEGHTFLADRIENFRTEVKTEAREQYTVLSGAITELRSELRSTRSELQSELQSTRSELHDRIDRFQSELRTEILDVRDELRTEIRAVAEEVRTHTHPA
ncbi:MAG: hypothetical protein ABIO65_08330, partial [Nitrospiria bacterium]